MDFIIKIINSFSWSDCNLMINDILITINNSFLADTIDYFSQLNESGIFVSLMWTYISMYLFLVVMLCLRFFINTLFDPLIEHLMEEYEKDWSWEEPTHYRNGLDYLPNVLMSLGRLTQQAKDDLAEIKRQEAEYKETMKRQAETIRLNTIEYEKYLEERRKHPFTKEEEKSELKFILDEMHKQYGHLFDEENPQ